MLALFFFEGIARHRVLREISEQTDVLVYFSHAYCKFQHFPSTKGFMCVWARSAEMGARGEGGGEKRGTVGKYQQVVIYIRTRTNKPKRKELLRSQESVSCGFRQPAS